MAIKSSLISLSALLAVAGLSGCVNMNSNRYSTDRTTFTDVPTDQLESDASRCDLRLCVQEQMSRSLSRGMTQKVVLNALLPHFTSVKMIPTFTPADCDIAIHYDSINIGNKADLVSVHTGEYLVRLNTVFTRMGALACGLLKDGAPLFNKIPGTAALAYRTNRPVYAPVAAAPVPAAPAPAAAPAPTVETLVPSFKSAERPDDLAVIVGIETYSEIQTKANFAERDADAFKAYVRALGVPERNIVLLKGSKAGKASIEKNVETWLARLAKPTSRVYFYFSGHGAPDVKTGQAYLVPWDGDPNFLKNTAYPVTKLYKELGALPAKEVLVAMDSCFSGAGGRSVLASGARPLVAKIDVGAAPAKLTVLAASGPSEISGSLDDKGHGAFTYFLLEGLDAGKTTPKALAEYLTPRVQDEAKRLNRDQTPQLQGDGSWSLR